MIFSPPSKPTVLSTSPTVPVSAIAPVMRLGRFSESIYLEFGSENNIVGIPRSMPFKLHAVEGDTEVEVTKVPRKKGFSVDFQKVKVGKNETIVQNVTWTPMLNGGVREVILLALPGRGRLQITCHGTATGGASDTTEPKPKPSAKSKFQRRMSLKKPAAKKPTPLPSLDVDNVSSKLKTTPNNPPPPPQPLRKALKVPTKTPKKKTQPTPKKPRATHAKTARTSSQACNYDEHWAEKQQFALTSWINYVFRPTEDEAHEEQLQQILASKSEDSEETQQSAQEALDRAALRTLLVHRRHNSARSASAELFNARDFADFRYNLSKAVKDGKLAVRVDRDMYADLGLRGQILSLLMSYQTEWLRLGLETVYGEEVRGVRVAKRRAEMTRYQFIDGQR